MCDQYILAEMLFMRTAVLFSSFRILLFSIVDGLTLKFQNSYEQFRDFHFVLSGPGGFPGLRSGLFTLGT